MPSFGHSLSPLEGRHIKCKMYSRRSGMTMSVGKRAVSLAYVKDCIWYTDSKFSAHYNYYMLFDFESRLK